MASFPKKRKYRIRKKRVYFPSEAEKERLRLVKRLYDEYGTLEKVGSVLLITRERVRQLLEKGENYKLFTYELTRVKKFKNILARIDKEKLTEEVRNTSGKLFDICSNLDIDIKTLFRLLRYYNVDISGYRKDSRYKKCLNEYTKMVEVLGYHPSTTVMQRNRKWRSLWTRIIRLWGSIDRFRNEFGIEKPKFALHPNTISAFRQAKERRMANKKIKVENVVEIVTKFGPISTSGISKLLGYSNQSVYLYLKELISKNKLRSVGVGNRLKYNIIK